MVPEEFGSSEAGKKGGKARADKLSKEQLSEQARIAAEARWGTKLPIATYGDDDHPLRIGNGLGEFLEIPCYVLDDRRRVLVQRGMLTSLNMKQGTAGRGEGDRLVRFINTKSINPFVTPKLADVITKPIKFRTPNGNTAYGYEATVLADLCDAVLEARRNEALNYQQEHIAIQCEILVRGFARVGIIALVDEATGYERAKQRDDLAKILEAFVAKEIQGYLKTFELEFYELMCELRGEPLERAKKRPAYFGKLTDNLVYMRLAPGVRAKLRELNPVQDNGRRKRKHFQHLTADLGHPKLKEHLAGVTTAMKMAKIQGLEWDDFMKLLDKTHPKQKELPLLDPLDGI